MSGNRYRRAHKRAQTAKMHETVKERSLKDLAERIYRESTDIGAALDAMVAIVKSDSQLTTKAIRLACTETLLRLESTDRRVTEDLIDVKAKADAKLAQGYRQEQLLQPSRNWLFGSKIADAIQALKFHSS
jgi:hypothetical protein